jgi:hypothetical protein
VPNWAQTHGTIKSAAVTRLSKRLYRLVKAKKRLAGTKYLDIAVRRLPLNDCTVPNSENFIVLLAIAAADSHPLTPFIVGDERDSDDEDGENAKENLHDAFRIA